MVGKSLLWLYVSSILTAPVASFQVANFKSRQSTSLSSWYDNPYGSSTAVREMSETVGSLLPMAPPRGEAPIVPRVEPDARVGGPIVRGPLLPLEGGPVRRDIRRGKFGDGPDGRQLNMAQRDAMIRGRGRFDTSVSGRQLNSAERDAILRGGGILDPSDILATGLPGRERSMAERDAILRGGGSIDPSDSSPIGPTVQGGSLRTYHKGYSSRNPDEKTVVEFGTDGRPLEGNFKVWDGPDNTPTNVNIYSQDGYNYGFRMVTGRRSGAYYGGSESYQVRNTGPMEFPLRARVDRTQYQYDSYGGYKSIHNGGGVSDQIFPVGERRSIRESPYAARAPPNAKTIQGGSNKTYNIGPRVESVKVELHSQGLPIMARVELLQGPNNVKTLAQVYQQDGHDRPFIGIMDTPGPYKGSIRIVNDGPMEFPITASVQPYEEY